MVIAGGFRQSIQGGTNITPSLMGQGIFNEILSHSFFIPPVFGSLSESVAFLERRRGALLQRPFATLSERSARWDLKGEGSY